MLILKRILQNALQRGGKKYVVIVTDAVEEVYNKLANDLIQFIPYLYLLNRKENSARGKSETYDILTHTLGNN